MMLFSFVQPSYAGTNLDFDVEIVGKKVDIDVSGAQSGVPIVLSISNDNGRVFVDQKKADANGLVSYYVILDNNDSYVITAIQDNEKLSKSIVLESDNKATYEYRINQEVDALSKTISTKNTYTFREALALGILEDSKENKAKINSKFHDGKLIDPTDYAGVILASYGLENVEASKVKTLLASQNEQGYFKLGKYYSKINQVIWSAIALNRQNVDFDEKAITLIVNAVDNDGKIEDTDLSAMALMALAPYESSNPSAKQAVVDIKDYLKSHMKVIVNSQNTCTLASVIQGLTAVGENPLDKKWYVDDNNLVNALIDSLEKKNYSDNMSNEQALLALIDLSFNRSIYTDRKIDGQHKTEIYVDWKKPSDSSGDTGNDNQASVKTIKVYVKANGKTLLALSKAPYLQGESVMAATSRILSMENISHQITHGGSYIASIAGISDFDQGVNSGWMLKVNGRFPSESAAYIDTEKGMKIEWLYTKDYTKESSYDSDKDSEDDKSDVDSKIDAMTKKYGEDKKITSPKELADDLEAALDSLVTEHKKIDNEKMKDSIDSLTRIADRLIESAPSKTYVNRLLKSFKEVEKVTETSDEKVYLQKKVHHLVERYVEEKTTEVILKSEIKTGEDGAVVGIDKAIMNLEKMSSEALTDAEKMLEDNGLSLPEKVETALTIKIPEVSTSDETRFTVSDQTQASLKNSSVEKINVQLQDVTVSLSKNLLTEVDDDISFSVKEQPSSLGRVFDFTLKVGGKKLSQFDNFIEIELPLADGMDEENLTVYYSSPTGEQIVMGGYYDEEKNVMRFRTNHFSKYYVAPVKHQFKDIAQTDYEAEIEKAYARGIISGKSLTTFDPNGHLTRGEYAAIISNILKLTHRGDDKPFNDVSDNDWYHTYIQKVYENNIIIGVSENNFNPNGNLTRQEVGVIAYKILLSNGYIQTDEDMISNARDKGEIASWAQSGVNMALIHEVLKVTDEGMVDPQSTVTRGEVAEIMNVLFELIYE